MKSSFSLIELVFAIVIMGIAILSVPIILNTNSNSIEFAMDSRSIYHGGAKINIIKNFYWDESNLLDETILATDITDELACPRDGHYDGLYRRKCGENSATDIGFVGEFDSINDFDNLVESVGGYTLSTKIEYIPYNHIQNAMSYSNSDTSPDKTSIKRIKVSIKKGDGSDMNYYYYATNIGVEPQFVKPN